MPYSKTAMLNWSTLSTFINDCKYRWF